MWKRQRNINVDTEKHNSQFKGEERHIILQPHMTEYGPGKGIQVVLKTYFTVEVEVVI